MKQANIQEIKELLEGKRREILECLAGVNNIAAVDDSAILDEADEAAKARDDGISGRVFSRYVKLLGKISDALIRIKEGEFGKCEECEEEIGLARLRARPTATLCITCKEKQEKWERGFWKDRQEETLK